MKPEEQEVLHKAYRYRLYPNPEQISWFISTFACCRKVWNLMLEDRNAAYERGDKPLIPSPATYKKEYPYLKDTDSLALTSEWTNLKQAFARFHSGKSGFPKFKAKKHSRQSYTTFNQNGTISLDAEDGTVLLPKIKWVKAKLHRLPKENERVKSATVSMTPDGKFWCSVVVEYDKPESAFLNEENAVGLDYKSDGLYVTSDGEVCGSPKYFRKGQERLARAQRKLRHKQKDSRNWEKAKRKIAKEHIHIANQRKDFLHKKAAGIANRYDIVCVEELDMGDMERSFRNMGKATCDNGYGKFLTLLEHKLTDEGKLFIAVDKWFPSSQLCSACGYKNPAVKDLKVRRWTCPECGAKHDRDVNAAINIREKGVEEYLSA